MDIYTIIFLALAVFIFLRLRSVLGQRTGSERPPFDRTARKLVAMFQQNFTKFEDMVEADVRAAAPAVRIAPRPHRLRVATDGEVRRLDTPLNYRVRPGALRVLVPAASKTEETPP